MFYKESDIVKEITTSTVRLRLLNNSIVHYTYLKGAEIDIPQHKINHDALKEIAVLKKHPLLIDSTEFVQITNDCRKYIRSLEGVAPILARAIVTEFLANKLLTQFYLKVNKPQHPFKIFSHYHHAVDWLISLQE